MRTVILCGFDGFGKLFESQIRKSLQLAEDYPASLFSMDSEEYSAALDAFKTIQKQVSKLKKEKFGTEVCPEKQEWVILLDDIHSPSAENMMMILKSEAKDDRAMIAGGLSYPAMMAAVRFSDSVDDLGELKKSIEAENTESLQIILTR